MTKEFYKQYRGSRREAYLLGIVIMLFATGYPLMIAEIVNGHVFTNDLKWNGFMISMVILCPVVFYMMFSTLKWIGTTVTINDTKVEVIDLYGRHKTFPLVPGASIKRLGYSFDGKNFFLISGDYKTAIILGRNYKSEIKEFDEYVNSLSAVGFSPEAVDIKK